MMPDDNDQQVIDVVTPVARPRKGRRTSEQACWPFPIPSSFRLKTEVPIQLAGTLHNEPHAT